MRRLFLCRGMKKLVVSMVCMVCAAGCGIQLPTLDQLFLRPSSEIQQTPADLGMVYEEATVPVAEGRTIVVWHVPSEQSKALVVVVPGADANKGRYVEGLKVLQPFGYDVILMDYEGFGDSPGTASLASTVDDTFAAVAYAKSLHDNIFVFGVSLGAPLAARVAAEYELKGCLLEGSLILLDEAELWLLDHDIDYPPAWILANMYIHPQTPEAYDIRKYIQWVAEPKLFLQSVEDEITPYEGAVQLFNLAPEPKELWAMEGEHGKMIRINQQVYSAKITGWMDTQLGLDAASTAEP